MKKYLVALLALLLAVTFVLTGCSSHGKTLMEAGGVPISINVFQLYLSRMKGSLATAGFNVNSPAFWNSYVSTDNVTCAEYYTAQVFQGLRQIAAAMILYEESGLKLDSVVKKDIDKWIDSLIEEVGEGSKSKLNSVLATYGANIETLRDSALIEARLEQLKEHLYGKNGSLVSDNAKEEFFQKTYFRGYQLQLANYYYDRQKDENGQTVFYTDATFKHVAYDTDGKDVLKLSDADPTATPTDAFGDAIYVYKDKTESGKWLIAYDVEKGQPKYFYDEKGDRKIVKYTEVEMEARLKKANEIAEKCKGNEKLFLQCIRDYSDNVSFNDTYAPNGMYFAAGSYTADTIFSTFSTELAKLEIGDLVVLNSDTGYYILMRATLDNGAWKNEANKKWFSSLNDLVVEYMLQQRTKDYLERVTFDAKLLEKVDITTVGANNYY